MKKFLIYSGIAATVFAVTSCQSDLDVPGTGGPGNVHFTVELPSEISTRAFADGTTAKNLTYAVYSENTLVSQGTALIADRTATVNIDLASGATYDVVFWAEADNSPFTFSADSRQVTVDYALMSGNNDNGDAFFHIENGIEVSGPVNRSVTLTRPCAQLNLGTTDLNSPSVVKAYPDGVYTSVKAEAYTTLNLKDGTVANPVEVELPATLPPSAQENFPVAGDYRYLSMVYLLVPAEGGVSDLTISSYATAGGAASHSFDVPNAPLKRNYRTNIYGSLLSSTTNWDISIDNEFGGGASLSVWDGTESAPTVDEATKSVTIAEASQLAGFARAVNNGNTYRGYTVTLTTDIDLNNRAWTPAGNVASYPSITFAGTFDGNGHTIYNLNASSSGTTYASAGLFGSLLGKVKNLTMKKGKVNSTHYAGAIAGFSSANNIEISNCTVEGFTIISTPELFGSTYDNGDKAGGVIGYMDGGDKVTNCVVRDCTVKGYRDIGGIVGCCNNGGPVSGCTVENVTLIQDFANGYKNISDVEGLIGAIYGRGSNTGTGNTESNVTITYANRPGTLADRLAEGGNITISEATDLIDLSDLNPAKPLNLYVMAPVEQINIGTTQSSPKAITIEIADGVSYPQFIVASSTQSVRNLTIKGTPSSSKALSGFSTRSYTTQNFGNYIGNQPKDMTNVTFSGVHFDGYGIYLAHNNGMTVSGLTIEDCNFTNMLESAVAFQAGGNHGNVEIKNNNISFSLSAPASKNGLYLLDFTGPLTVSGNTIAAATYHGIFCKSNSSAATTLINGNTIINPREDGVKIEDYTANATVSGNMISAQGNGVRVKTFTADNTVTVSGNTINSQNMKAFSGGEPWGILIIGSNTSARPVINVTGNKKVGNTDYWFELTGVTPAASSNYSHPF